MLYHTGNTLKGVADPPYLCYLCCPFREKVAAGRMRAAPALASTPIPHPPLRGSFSQREKGAWQRPRPSAAAGPLAKRANEPRTWGRRELLNSAEALRNFYAIGLKWTLALQTNLRWVLFAPALATKGPCSQGNHNRWLLRQRCVWYPRTARVSWSAQKGHSGSGKTLQMASDHVIIPSAHQRCQDILSLYMPGDGVRVFRAPQGLKRLL
jgi:hypothetical protein